jgi:ATP-dependent Lhr-like helicase
MEISVAGERRLIAVEDAGRYRDALGVPLAARVAGGVSGTGAGGDAGPAAALRAHAWAIHRAAECAARFGLPLRAWRRRWSGW